MRFMDRLCPLWEDRGLGCIDRRGPWAECGGKGLSSALCAARAWAMALETFFRCAARRQLPHGGIWPLRRA